MKNLINSINDFFDPDFKKHEIGAIYGEFDLILEDYFSFCKKRCHQLWVFVEDSSDGSDTAEKISKLYNTEGVDGVLVYSGESHLISYIKELSPDIIFLDSKHKDKKSEGFGINCSICYLDL
jgi:hypothetical protein